MSHTAHALHVPEDAVQDPSSVEMLRAWVAGGNLQCTLNIGAGPFDDPSTWGLLLADVTRHVANAHCERDGADPEEVAAAIFQLYYDELMSPTDELVGEFVS